VAARSPRSATAPRASAVAAAAMIALDMPPGRISHRTACSRQAAWQRSLAWSRCRLEHIFSTARRTGERSAATATDRASFAFLPDRPADSSRTRSPAARSCWASRCPSPLEEAKRFIEQDTATHARLAFILLDNAVEILMFRNIEVLLSSNDWDEQLLRLHDEILERADNQEIRLSRDELAGQIVHKRRRRELTT
jgi:hypothetical protein